MAKRISKKEVKEVSKAAKLFWQMLEEVKKKAKKNS